jgi:sialic acid synthase SpsE
MKTKIILEIGYNHNGSYEKAMRLIDEAVKLGVWAVKFQKWEIEAFPECIKNIKRKDDNSYGVTYYEHRKRLEFDIETIKELKEYAEKKGLVFICSGKDFQSLIKLVDAGVKYIKLPSQRYLDNNIFNWLCSARKKKDLKLFVSSGMHNGKQVLSSKWTEMADVLFHCVSLYPAPLKNMHFNFMRNLFYLRLQKGKACGYSSHEIYGKAIKYSIAMGATYIERHFTLDKKDKGSDHSISSDVRDVKRMIKDIEEIEIMLGSSDKPLSAEEKELKKYYKSF